MRGSGEKGRITAEDVKVVLRGPAAAPAAAAGGMGIPEVPTVDFSKFGATETRPLARIRRLSGPHLHRAWLNVPHVTHGDEADITDIEAYRRELDAAGRDQGYRVTLLLFLMKASVSAMRAFPEFNSSLSPDKESLIYKNYCNIGIAVDTPEGLVVPVLKDVDRKGIIELSRELGAASKKARDGKLAPGDMQGAASPSPASAASAASPSRRSSTHRRWRSSASCARRWRRCGRRGVRAEADAAALRVVRPSRDRRGARRPLHAAFVHDADVPQL